MKITVNIPYSEKNIKRGTIMYQVVVNVKIYKGGTVMEEEKRTFRDNAVGNMFWLNFRETRSSLPNGTASEGGIL